jgi:hypothetical protein
MGAACCPPADAGPGAARTLCRDDGLLCSAGDCVACGAPGQPCCAGPGANNICRGEGVSCLASMCVDCSGPDRAVCNGVCVDLNTDQNCGTCGATCATAAGERCLRMAAPGTIDGGVTMDGGVNLAFCLQCPRPLNLITNGSFTAGRSGFTSEYTYDDSRNSTTGFGGGTPEGNFTVTNNPSGWNGAFRPFAGLIWTDGSGDRSGFAAVFNGIGRVAAYQASVSVSAGTEYVIRYRAADWGGKNTTVGRRSALLEVSVARSPIAAAIRLPGADGENMFWTSVQASYRANRSETVDLRIVNVEIGDQGNDFALDDIRFEQVAAPECRGDGGVGDGGR